MESPGQFGIRIKDANDFATVLTGMYLDLAPVQLKIGLGAPKLARDFLAALPLLGAKPGQTQAFLNFDCIGKFARFGGLARSLDDATREVMSVAAEARKADPTSAPSASTPPSITRPAPPKHRSWRPWRPRSSPT